MTLFSLAFVLSLSPPLSLSFLQQIYNYTYIDMHIKGEFRVAFNVDSIEQREAKTRQTSTFLPRSDISSSS